MADLHDLVAAYAVDALDASERAQFEAHLADCPDCAAELAILAPATTGLAEAASSPPPKQLKANVIEAVASTPQDRATKETIEPVRQRFTMPRWVIGLAAAAVVVVALGVSGLFSEGVTLDEVTNAADSAAVALDGAVGSARFVYSDSLDTGFFIAAQLPEVSEGETYQLWLIADGAAAPAGTFRPDSDGSVTFRVEGEIDPGKTLGMTVEPAGGSTSPTGEVLLAEILG